jgi:hypothetical protein
MDTLALVYLFDQVRARFAADGTQVPNLFGWKKHTQTIETADRICWMPGDAGGSAGAVLSAREPGPGDGDGPRSLATLEELCTVDIFGSARDKLQDELAQYAATRLLYDAWYRAVYLAGRGLFRLLSTTWVVPKTEHRFGMQLRVVLAVRAKIPDAPIQIAPVDTNASIAVSNGETLDQIDLIKPTDPVPEV